ncbi:hypothetical protein YTPLAS72_10140 [Nitrospira sp.]|nr:hypothetical protein YTPLAS72_10140 [Nitrospira sp.]
MRVRPTPASPFYPQLRVAFTDHPITVWAGVILLRLYFELLGLRAALIPLLEPFAKTSNNQIPAVDVLLAWWYGLALGAERFEHLTRYRRDPLLPRLLGLPRFPSPDTVRRFFGRFTYHHTTNVSEALMRLSLQRLRPTLLGHTLDLDSTVFCRYGEQDGSLKGHNPIKHGRPSHHPLMAWLSERRRLLWATLRAGHAGTANGVREFLAQALTMLPTGHRISLVRADAGFCVTSFFTALESRDLPYIIVARLTPLVRKLVIHRIPDVDWQPITRDIAVADVRATLPSWRGQARRFVCLHQTLTERPTASGRRLIECPGYTYRVFITTIPFAPELV